MRPSWTLMVTNERTLRRRLPVDGQQDAQGVLGGHRRQTPEDVAQVRQRFDAAALAGDDDRVDDRGALAGIGVADEEPVFLSDGRRPDRVLNEARSEALRG